MSFITIKDHEIVFCLIQQIDNFRFSKYVTDLNLDT